MDWTRGGDDYLAEVAQIREDDAAEQEHDAYHSTLDRDPDCWYCRPGIADDLRDRIDFLEDMLDANMLPEHKLTAQGIASLEAELDEKRALLAEMEG